MERSHHPSYSSSSSSSSSSTYQQRRAHGNQSSSSSSSSASQMRPKVPRYAVTGAACWRSRDYGCSMLDETLREDPRLLEQGELQPSEVPLLLHALGSQMGVAHCCIFTLNEELKKSVVFEWIEGNHHNPNSTIPHLQNSDLWLEDLPVIDQRLSIAEDWSAERSIAKGSKMGVFCKAFGYRSFVIAPFRVQAPGLPSGVLNGFLILIHDRPRKWLKQELFTVMNATRQAGEAFVRYQPHISFLDVENRLCLSSGSSSPSSSLLFPFPPPSPVSSPPFSSTSSFDSSLVPTSPSITVKAVYYYSAKGRLQVKSENKALEQGLKKHKRTRDDEEQEEEEEEEEDRKRVAFLLATAAPTFLFKDRQKKKEEEEDEIDNEEEEMNNETLMKGTYDTISYLRMEKERRRIDHIWTTYKKLTENSGPLRLIEEGETGSTRKGGITTVLSATLKSFQAHFRQQLLKPQIPSPYYPPSPPASRRPRCDPPDSSSSFTSSTSHPFDSCSNENNRSEENLVVVHLLAGSRKSDGAILFETELGEVDPIPLKTLASLITDEIAEVPASHTSSPLRLVIILSSSHSSEMSECLRTSMENKLAAGSSQPNRNPMRSLLWTLRLQVVGVEGHVSENVMETFSEHFHRAFLYLFSGDAVLAYSQALKVLAVTPNLQASSSSCLPPSGQLSTLSIEEDDSEGEEGDEDFEEDDEEEGDRIIVSSDQTTLTTIRTRRSQQDYKRFVLYEISRASLIESDLKVVAVKTIGALNLAVPGTDIEIEGYLNQFGSKEGEGEGEEDDEQPQGSSNWPLRSSTLAGDSISLPGRREKLFEIVETLLQRDMGSSTTSSSSPPASPKRVVCLYGLPGIGKSECMKAAGHWLKDRQRVSSLVWVSLEPQRQQNTSLGLRLLLSSIAKVIPFSTYTPPREEDFISYLKRKERIPGILLGIQGFEYVPMEEREAFLSYLSLLPPGNLVLLTSTEKIVSSFSSSLNLKNIRIDRLSKYQSFKMLKGSFPRLNATDTAFLHTQITPHLCGFPSAILQAISKSRVFGLEKLSSELATRPSRVLSSYDETTSKPSGLWVELTSLFSTLPQVELSLFLRIVEHELVHTVPNVLVEQVVVPLTIVLPEEMDILKSLDRKCLMRIGKEKKKEKEIGEGEEERERQSMIYVHKLVARVGLHYRSSGSSSQPSWRF